MAANKPEGSFRPAAEISTLSLIVSGEAFVADESIRLRRVESCRGGFFSKQCEPWRLPDPDAAFSEKAKAIPHLTLTAHWIAPSAIHLGTLHVDQLDALSGGRRFKITNPV